MATARRPEEPIETPAAVVRLAEEEPVDVVWRNQMGGLTFAVGRPVEFYVKWHPMSATDDHIDLAEEARRMRWAATRVPVPEVLGVGGDDTSSWLCTRALAGRSAVDERWKADPATAVRAIGLGLRRLHEGIPIDDCPYDWRTGTRLALARRRLDGGDLVAERIVGPEPTVTAAEAVAILEAGRPTDDVVVCHGDACAPNTLLDAEGNFLALVDLGNLGVGDRWADLAVATWSTEWNYGPGWDDALLEAYGIESDPDRMRYFRLLWDVGP